MKVALRGISTLLLGLMAGFFATYSFNVNYAMMEVDGETYATVQSLFNINVRHSGFFICFFGAGLLPAITGVATFQSSKREGICWILVALVYFLGIIMFTKFINLPLNYYTESWDPSAVPLDWKEVRDNWNTANLFRVGISMATFLSSLALLSFSSPEKARHAQEELDCHSQTS